MTFDKDNELHMKLRSRDQKLGFLEIAASIPKQLEYEENVPSAQVQNEMIVNWNMGQPLSTSQDAFPREVYSDEEIRAVRQFDKAVEVVWSRVEGTLRPIRELQNEPFWHDYVASAARTRDVLMKRGYTFDFPEDRF